MATAARRPRVRPVEPTGSGRGWKEQLRRISELSLLGVLAALACLPVLTAGAVVATLSRAVGHWADHDDLPPWSEVGREFVRRLLPGALVSVAGALAVVVFTLERHWLRSGAVPGGGAGLAVLWAVAAVLLAVVLLAVPRLADGPGRTWRAALALGWTALLRVPPAGAAALA
ncbi:hypothetical protein, partial [Kineococcus glutinatus]|uniref:hypothetical protein n=1 Tax=Kineococcus glutinatus TaxID=1070872 RepID=UPI0031EF823B